jgi:hypothetical protein
MIEKRIEIGVVLARRTLASAWADHAWQAHAVLPAAPPLRPGTPLGTGDGCALVYGGGFELVLHGGAAAFYRDNLQAGASLWVATTPTAEGCRVVAVTADPYEGEALTEAVDTTVDAVAMPEPVRAAIAEFIGAFPVQQPFFKRERDRADVDALGVRPRGRDRP